MRILTIAAVIAGLLLGAAIPAAAQKAKSGWCSQSACVAACIKNGG